MRMNDVGGKSVGKRKLRLLPLFALVIGLCVPIYSYAASEAECTACHNWCSSNASSGYQQCYAQSFYYDQWGWNYFNYESYSQCTSAVSAQQQACHEGYCGSPGHGCVD
jgi:hypothetical protein